MKRDSEKFKTPIEVDSILGRKGPLTPGLRVKYYDFCRPDKFSKDQIRTVQIMHETFARLTTTSLSAQLRSLIHIHVDNVDQLTYEEFIRSIPSPSTLAILNMDPLRGSAVLEIDPQVTSRIIDRIFGGKGSGTGLSRDLTDIEASVMEAVVIRIMANLREAWSTVIDLRPRLGQIETNPQFAMIVPPSEMVLLVPFEFMFEGAGGRMNLCVPYLTIEPIISKLSAQYWYSTVRRGKNAPPRDVSGLKAEARIHFASGRLGLADVFGLKKNSLVKLDDAATAFLSVGGATVCRLKAKRERGRLAFTAAGAAEDVAAVGADHKAEADRLESLIQTPLEKLSQEMRSAVETMTGAIAEVRKRQQELGDQIFHNGHGRETAGEVSERAGGGKPFGFITADDRDFLFNCFQMEHPQLVALVLSFLDPALAADIVARFSDEAQADLAERIALMERCAPEVIREVERVLEKQLARVGREKTFLQETDAIIGILNVSGRRVEKNVIGRLEKSNPELAEQIKRKLFVFEDIVLLDDRAIRKLIPRIEPSDLLLALKAVNEKTREKFLHNLEPEEQKKFAEDTQFIGPVRLVDADKAQQRIIGLIRLMEEGGEIIVARPDDLVMP
ncbi:MAG: flagellar motor switch protein FliM [Spirochaetales bacterium]|nr:flagellar motor switch protein FliM [Spirochaetales bacterium]